MGIKLRKKTKDEREASKRRKKYKKRSQEKIPTLVHTQKEDYYERQDPSIDTHTLKKGEARMIRFIERGKRRGKYVGIEGAMPKKWSQPSGDQPHYIERQGRKFRKPIKKKK